MNSLQPMERHARKPVGPAHILWNIVADNDVFMQLKKSWTDDSDRNIEKKRDKKRASELVSGEESRLSKRKQQSIRNDSLSQSTPIGMVPWTKSKLYTNDIIGLHEEIIDLYHWLCPRNWEIRLRCKIVHQIKKVVKEVWPCAKVRVFGSTRTKLFLPTSDLDIVVSGFEPDVEWDSMGEPNHPTAVELLVTLRQALIARKVTDEAHSVVIDKAQVPIVKLTELRTKLSVDITFSAASSINAVKFVNDWQTRCFHTLRPLAFVLKQFIAHRELNEVFHGGLSSYGLILMLINFFQLHERGQDAMSRNSNLGVLLLEFLELYGINFNYRVVGIDPSGAGSRYARRDADNDQQQQHLLSVLDPFNKDNDVTRGSFAFEKVQSAFHFAYTEMEALIRPSSVASSDRTLVPSILSSVMQVHPETVFHRVWAERAFTDLVNLYGNECDDKPMDWVSSDTSSDEGNCHTDSFENDDEKDGPHSRNSARMGPASDCGTGIGDAESSLSNYGDDGDDKSVSTSPSLFVKLHGLTQKNVHDIIDLDAAERRANELHRSASLPPFNVRQVPVPKMLPTIVTNAFLPPHAQQEMHKLLASAPRAVVIPAQFSHPPLNHQPVEQLHQQHQHQHFSNANARRAPMGNEPVMNWNNRTNNNNNNNVNNNNNQWMTNGRRNGPGNVSESSSVGPNDQAPQMPRRFHNNMSRRGGNNDRYGRLPNHNYSFGSNHHHFQHNQPGLQRSNGSFVDQRHQRIDDGRGNFRNNAQNRSGGGGMMHHRNNNNNNNVNNNGNYPMSNMRTHALEVDPDSDCNPEEMLSMKIDRKKVVETVNAINNANRQQLPSNQQQAGAQTRRQQQQHYAQPQASSEKAPVSSNADAPHSAADKSSFAVATSDAVSSEAASSADCHVLEDK